MTIHASAQWVTHPAWVEPAAELTRTPVVRRRFLVPDEPAAASLSLAGLGGYTATLDGRPVTPAQLEPGSSDYARRVAVAMVDLAAPLAPGPHELRIFLGEGAAHVRQPAGRYTKFVGTRYPPRLIAQLDLVSGSGVWRTLLSDGAWEATLGATTASHWFGGEDYDARLVAADWVPAAVLGDRDSGGPALWRRQAPPVRVVTTLPAVQRRRTAAGGVVLDFGRNHAGRPRLTVDERLPAGATVELWPAENLDPVGVVDQTSTGRPIFDTYTAAGTKDSWHPTFCYHGYRYLELRCPDRPELLDHVDVVSEQLRSGNIRVGSFRCSDPVLDEIYHLTVRAVEANLFTVLTDCPHREKLGWLEQMHLVGATLAHCFDVRPQLSDMVTHLRDAQTATGLVPDIAPELTVFDGPFRDDVNWGSAVALIPLRLWHSYADLAPARAAWPAIQEYLRYLDGRLVDGLLPEGLADWKTLDPSTPATLVHGHGLLTLLQAVAELADALGRHPEPYLRRARQVRARLAEEHVRSDGTVGSGSQASYALALDAGIVPAALVPDALGHLDDRLGAEDHRVSVGEIGLPPLFRVLSVADRQDLLLALVTNPRGPGYVNMIATGCTALAETWEVIQGEASANHFMLGYVVSWLTEDVAGLRQAESSRGWRAAVVEPRTLALLDSAEVGFDSPAGRYAVSWSWDADRSGVWLDVAVPDGGAVQLRCPRGFRLLTGATELTTGPHRVRLVPES